VDSIATQGFDSSINTFQLSDGSLINCQIYDTAGQERYNSINLNYYRKADAILLVYDISQKKTFNKIKDFYVESIKNKCKEDVIILLIGNKSDLVNKRQVKVEEGINLASKEHYEFKESSCLHNRNVAGAFEYLVETWNFRNKEKKEKQQNTPKQEKIQTRSSRIILDKTDNEKKNKKKKCC
jgi:Ras-related protein Rab-1A